MLNSNAYQSVLILAVYKDDEYSSHDKLDKRQKPSLASRICLLATETSCILKFLQTAVFKAITNQ